MELLRAEQERVWERGTPINFIQRTSILARFCSGSFSASVNETSLCVALAVALTLGGDAEPRSLQ